MNNHELAEELKRLRDAAYNPCTCKDLPDAALECDVCRAYDDMLDALTRVENVRTIIAALESVPRWISPEERLPEEDGQEFGFIVNSTGDVWRGWFTGKRIQCFETPDYAWHPREVRYWCSLRLPPVPEED